MVQPTPLKKETISSKKFVYSKDGCNLEFTLNIDVKKEIKDFLEILKVAVIDVEEELNKK